jgi:predicted DNA-binding transcriptional regulator AlpA
VETLARDDDWLTGSEIAKRVGRTRQSIGLLIRGDRGPGDFPPPVARWGSPNPLWSWAEVDAWFERYEPAAVRKRGSKLSPDFLAELNDRLDLRERLRHSPNAPWRPRLVAALPLGA